MKNLMSQDTVLHKIKIGTATIFLIIGFTKSSYSTEIVIKSKHIKSFTSDKIFDSIKPAVIPLFKQNLVAPHGGGSIKEIKVKSIYTDKELFIKVIWKDTTKDSKISHTEKISDAVAIEFPVNKNLYPSFIMGEKDNPVNIWLWKAVYEEKDSYTPKAYSDFYRKDAIENVLTPINVKSAENLIASGFGTLTSLEIQDIEAKGMYSKEEWSVIFKKKFESDSGVKINKNEFLPISFAVWDGNNKEIDGTKSVSVWHLILIGDSHIPKPKNKILAGERVFLRYGCISCHGKNGSSGISNFNAKGGKIPELTKVKEAYTADELKKFIRKGKSPDKEDLLGPHPPLRMNAWKEIIDEKELDNLVEYLFSLYPKEKKEDTW